MKYSLILAAILISYNTIAQDDMAKKDSTAFMDSLTKEIDAYLDMLIAPKSYLAVSINAGTGFYNFRSASGFTFNTEKKLLLSPSVSYIHKSGLGLTATGYAIADSGINMYQFSLTPSYDYIKPRRFSAGIAYTRYFTKDDLSFYTTPILNEFYAYFNYKKWWIEPAISVGYGWGSRTDYEKRRLDIQRRRLQLLLRRGGSIDIINNETIQDFSVLLSVRHNFRWKHLFSSKDLFTLTPVLLLSSGTQNYGFNTTYQTRSVILSNYLPGNQYISNKSSFDAQSLIGVLRLDYTIGKLYIQPQIVLDHYLHSGEKRFNNAYSLGVGVSF